MLVLTRRKNEQIHVDGQATFTVLEQRGNRTKIGIVAPPSTKITRGELIPRSVDLSHVETKSEAKPGAAGSPLQPVGAT